MWIIKQRKEQIRKFTGSRKTERKNNFALIKSVDDSKKKGIRAEREDISQFIGLKKPIRLFYIKLNLHLPTKIQF